MPKEIKEKIIEILKEEGLSLMTGEIEKRYEDPVVKKLSRLFSQEKQKWVEEILKKMKCRKRNHENQLCGGCEICQTYQKLKKSF